MIKIRAIYYQTGESQEKVLTPEILVQGGGLIGRNLNCDLVLSSPEVSRVHGRILYQAGQYYYTDLGSTDGSQVNDQEVKTNQNFLLQLDDILRIGGFILLVKELDLQAAELSSSKANLNGNNRTTSLPTSLPTSPPNSLLSVSDEAIAPNDSSSSSSNNPPHPFPKNSGNFAAATETPPAVQQLIFKAEELKEKGILNQSTECTVQGKVLVEGISFSKRLREKAIALWQAELDSGKLCLLVEYPEHFTLWQEKEL